MRIKFNILGFSVDLSTESVKKEEELSEFWLAGFNDEGLDTAFRYIVQLYDEILSDDDNWHYFYESSYSLVRCSKNYESSVAHFFADNEIEYTIGGWEESTYMTIQYKDIYRELFHNFSVLVIQMYKNEDGGQLYFAADRIIHPFLNHALYLAVVDGQTEGYEENGFDILEWECIRMSDLARARAHYVGTAVGEKKAIERIQNYNNKIRATQEEEKEKSLANSK